MLTPVRKLMFRTEPPGPDTARREAQEREAVVAEPLIIRNYDRLDARLTRGGFLFGDFSVADISTFMMVLYTLRNGGPGLGKHRNIAAWFEKLSARPAFSTIMAEIADADRMLSHPVARKPD